jgi:hypothetical protein
MGFIEMLILRTLLFVGIPVALVMLALGPRRAMKLLHRGWTWLTQRRMEPEEILTQVVKQHQEHVSALQKALAQAEKAEAEIVANLKTSQENIVALEASAKERAQADDDLQAQADLYKLNLERMAAESFQEHLLRQRRSIHDSRRRLYQLELQLRQYEVGRSILLSQLAEAKSVEQQFAIASQFDPFNAVADWQKAEGLVQEKALSARAIERVYNDTADLAGGSTSVDPQLLKAQLEQLRAELNQATQSNSNESPEAPRRSQKERA